MEPSQLTGATRPSASAAIRRRRRPALSCQECRRRKIRCDHSSPCANCIRHKTKCSYSPFTYHEPGASASVRSGESSGTRSPRPTSATSTASPPPATLRLAPPTPLSGVQSLGQTVDTTPVAQNGSFLIPVASTSQDVELPSPDQSGQRPNQSEPNFNDILLKRIAKLEASLVAAQKGANNSPPIHAQHTLSAPNTERRQQTQEWQAVLNKPRDWGRSRWVGDTTEFAVVMACYSEIVGKASNNPAFQTPEAAALIAQAGDALRGCKNRAKNIKIARPTRGLPSPYACLVPPSLEVATQMAKLYFASFESTYVLDQNHL